MYSCRVTRVLGPVHTSLSFALTNDRKKMESRKKKERRGEKNEGMKRKNEFLEKIK
jgi:hypothetical protein